MKTAPSLFLPQSKTGTRFQEWQVQGALGVDWPPRVPAEGPGPMTSSQAVSSSVTEDSVSPSQGGETQTRAPAPAPTEPSAEPEGGRKGRGPAHQDSPAACPVLRAPVSCVRLRAPGL